MGCRPTGLVGRWARFPLKMHAECATILPFTLKGIGVFSQCSGGCFCPGVLLGGVSGPASGPETRKRALGAASEATAAQRPPWVRGPVPQQHINAGGSA